MRALRLDYRDHSNIGRKFGLGLMAVMLILAIWLGWYFNAIRTETQALEVSLAKMKRSIHGEVTATEISQMTPEKLAKAIQFSNQTIHQLNLPWDVLFSQLTTAKGEGVALLGVEPSAKSNTILVEGEAKDYAAMLQYVRRLSEQNILQGVYLTEHKMDEQNTDHPIHFTLEASWAKK